MLVRSHSTLWGGFFFGACKVIDKVIWGHSNLLRISKMCFLISLSAIGTAGKFHWSMP